MVAQRMVAVAVVLVVGVAQATTAFPLEGTCPVCGKRVETVAIGSSNNLGGQDTDFFERAAGDIPLLLAATTCPHCGFSGFPEDFGARLGSDGAKGKPPLLPPGLVERLKGGKALAVPVVPPWARRPSEPAARNRGIVLPSWGRLDLIAQVAELAGKPRGQLAFAWLRCAWGVRYDANPWSPVFNALGDLDRPAGRRGPGNRAVQDVETAHELIGKLAGMEKKAQRPAAVAIGYLLRAHGENEALLAVLPRLEPHFAAEEWAELEAATRASVTLERSYQAKSLARFTEALAERGVVDPKKRASEVWLSAELKRRMGDTAAAKAEFEAAKRLPGKPEWIDEAVGEQLAAIARDEKLRGPAPRDAGR